MERYFCNGKKGFCDASDCNTNLCNRCEFCDNSGGTYIDSDSSLFKAIKTEVAKEIFTVILQNLSGTIQSARSTLRNYARYNRTDNLQGQKLLCRVWTIDEIGEMIFEIKKKYVGVTTNEQQQTNASRENS